MANALPDDTHINLFLARVKQAESRADLALIATDAVDALHADPQRITIGQHVVITGAIIRRLKEIR